MSKQFCKVGKIKPNLNKIINLKEFEKKLVNFVEDISKIDFSESLNANF